MVIRRMLVSKKKLCIQNCDQIAADRDMVATDSLLELVIAVYNSAMADPMTYRLATIHALQTDNTSYPRLNSTVG